ncbi:MAG: hypothetical protein M9900_08585 [Flavobacteriales bacterium]|nr:hypothetical protein [Flavobacteriales bacterium]
MEDQLESLSVDIRELKYEVVGLKESLRQLNSTMSGLMGTGSDDFVGAIQKLQEEVEKLRKRLEK